MEDPFWMHGRPTLQEARNNNNAKPPRDWVRRYNRAASGWRREHAHRVWQAVQAFVAVMAIVDRCDSIFSEYWDEAERIGLILPRLESWEQP